MIAARSFVFCNWRTLPVAACLLPIIDCSDTAVIGKGFCIMQWCAGTAQARRLVRDAKLPDWGDHVVRAVAASLARLHALSTDRVQACLPFLTPSDAGTPVDRRLGQLRACLDEMPLSHPVLEYLINWLQANQPAAQRWVLLHGDCRTGNLLVHDGTLSALLDWEFADFGDPHEDLGWLTAPCWRFGNDTLAAGGLASDTVLLDAYAAAGGQHVNAAALAYWQLLAELRWAVIALLQAERCYTGGERSLELALTDRLVPDLEAGLLQRVAAIEGVAPRHVAEGSEIDRSSETGTEPDNDTPACTDSQDDLDAARLRQLLASARAALVDTLTPGLAGERKYTAALLRRAFDVIDAEVSGGQRRHRQRVLDELDRQAVSIPDADWSSLAATLRQSGSTDKRYLCAFLTSALAR